MPITGPQEPRIAKLSLKIPSVAVIISRRAVRETDAEPGNHDQMLASHRRRILDAGWFLACLVASSVWCLTAAHELGATFDEPLYLTRGLETWRSGSHAGLMKLGTMPLPVDWDTLPLYVWERWREKPFDVAADLDRILPVARAGTLAFWWLLLAYGWLAARRLAGPWGGRLAVAWLAAEPNLLAHASLATTDIAISACLVALIYHWQIGRDRTWPWRVGWPALWFAAAVGAKASGIVFGPLCMFVVELERLFRARSTSFREFKNIRSLWQLENLPVIYRSFGPFRRDASHVMAIGFVLVFMYCGCDWRPEPSFVAWAHKLPDSPVARSMVWLSEHLTIFSNAGEGLVRQIKHNMKGHHGAYLLGTNYPRAVWYYFPLALCIKLTIPLLMVIPAMAFWRRNGLVNWAMLSAGALLVFSVTCRVQIGIRLVLPLVVMLIIGVAAALVRAASESGTGWQRRVVAIGVVAGVTWTAVSSSQAWPNGLCYINEFWGGSERGYLCLSDSNYDWGQGVRELAQWRRDRGLEQLDVWYFGTDPAINWPPLRNVPLHTLPLARADDVPAFIQGRYVAVGTSLLFGTGDCGPACPQATEFFRHRKPFARTTTFLIYDLSPSSTDGPVTVAEKTAPRSRNRP